MVRTKKMIVDKSKYIFVLEFIYTKPTQIFSHINGKYSEISLNVSKEEYFFR